jgi:pimeloyl-ACP methyl ester carboxylesterase
LWGTDFHAVGVLFEMPKVWAEMADDLEDNAIAQCGHLLQEEQPEVVNELLMKFLKPWKG